MPDSRIEGISSAANLKLYEETTPKEYIKGAPHVKHRRLRVFYSERVDRVLRYAQQHVDTPHVLDLGAGEGSVTLPFLSMGAKVTAVDISENRLNSLKTKCGKYAQRLEVQCQDVSTYIDFVVEQSKTFDIVVTNAFLHHIPDYLGLINRAVKLLPVHGQFFSFQEPLSYDLQSNFTRFFSEVAYLNWRIFQGDITGGIKRRLRWRRGMYQEESMHDYAEYHAMRRGLDQLEIYRMLEQHGFECDYQHYFSTQSRFWQFLGALFGLENTFTFAARRQSS